jgi:hypothetical protein
MRKKKSLLFIFFSFFSLTAISQNYTISGYITDNSSGETMINASVYDLNSKKGTVSNAYGFYSLTIPAGMVDLQFSYVGYTGLKTVFKLAKDTVINIKMIQSVSLEEITVTANQKISGVKSSQMGVIEVPITQIKNIPTLFGEADLIKALQLLPGVQNGSEGSNGFYVRGGGPDQNLFLLDGAPIYNVNHMAGFFSVFNPDAIKNVTFYKGSFPARFGGRLSSVVDIRMNDGNDKKLSGNVTLGVISSKITLEGPLFSKNTTFHVSARRTYSDLIIQPIIYFASKAQNFDAKMTAGYYFYDLNAKVSHKFSDKDRLFLSLYSGDDIIYANVRDGYSSFENGKYESRMKMDWNWGNFVTSLRWNHLINNKLFMNATATYNQYRFSVGVGNESVTEWKNPPQNMKSEIYLGYNSGIRDYAFKLDFDYTPHPDHNVKFGTNYTSHRFTPGVSVFQVKETANTNIEIDTTIGENPIDAHETIFYVEDDINLGYAVKMNLGLHYSMFGVQNEVYQSVQPRASMRFLVNEKLSFKTGYAAMSQNIHLLSNSNISMPTDLWVPATSRVKPMNSHQVALGAFYNLNNLVDLSAEAYYKSMHNLIEYKDGASFFGSSTGWEDKVVVGDGWSYGLELMAQKNIGKTTGWVAYTWSKSERLFNRPGQEINFGRVFPAKYDRRHDFKVVVTHKFSEKIDLTGTWVYGSGNAGTLALQKYGTIQVPGEMTNYYYDGYGSGYNSYSTKGNITETIEHISGRNNFRFNPYHRMDIGVNFHKKKKHGTRTWNLSAYNVYNNLNPFLVYTKTEMYWNPITLTYSSEEKLVQLSIFTFIPSISYTYKW